MKESTERHLMRRLHGELPDGEAHELERRMAGDPELAAAYRRLEAAWESLELPDAGAPPPGFTGGVVRAARKIRDGELSWALAPAWARAGAAAALSAGLLLGAAFGGGFTAPSPSPELEQTADLDADGLPLSMAEVYWLALEDSEGSFAAAADGEEGTAR